jgi:hypothetical protein
MHDIELCISLGQPATTSATVSNVADSKDRKANIERWYVLSALSVVGRGRAPKSKHGKMTLDVVALALALTEDEHARNCPCERTGLCESMLWESKFQQHTC